jgi:glycerol uptake facilitator-like aquaporin
VKTELGENKITSLNSLWVYLVATILGGIIAGIWEEFHNHMINVMNIDAK